MSGWAKMRLGEVATISSGGTPSKARADFWGGDIPWVSPNDMKSTCIEDTEDKITMQAVAQSATRIVGPSSVLAVVRSGILAHTFPVATVGREVSFNQDIQAITPRDDRVLPTFLYWILRGREREILRIGVKRGATVHSLANGFLEKLQFRLPPIDEQRRMVALLDRATEIRRRVDAAREKARAIIPALFLDTFGDPVTNPKGWPVVRVGELVERIEGGWSPKCDDAKPSRDQWAVLKLSAVKASGFNENEAKTLPDQGCARPALEVHRGDLLFTRKNTLELVGTAAVIRHDSSRRMLPDTVFRLIAAKPERYRPEYLSTLINMSSFRPAIRALASGSASSMPGISKARLRQLAVPVPPIDVQAVWTEQIDRVEGLTGRLNASAANSEAMCAALSAEVFGTEPLRNGAADLTGEAEAANRVAAD